MVPLDKTWATFEETLLHSKEFEESIRGVNVPPHHSGHPPIPATSLNLTATYTYQLK